MTEHTAADFDAKFETLLAGCAAITKTFTEKNFPTSAAHVFTAERGRRYVRVVRSQYGNGSVHCFVDATNGNVLKAGGWKAPAANGVRGNIYADDNGLGCMSQYGVAYLR